jgi:hypothetical protein
MIPLILITLIALTIAVAMSVVAWRLIRQERRRSDARVAALAAEIREHDVPSITEEPLPVAMHAMFAARSDGRGRLGPVGILAVGIVVVGSLLALVTTLNHRSRVQPEAASVEVARAPDPPAGPPLELVALSHQRDGDRILVKGAVRGSRTSASGFPLTAVVYVFDHEGTFVASGRAPLAPAAPGDLSNVESTFAVSISGIRDVYRYRVSFRDDEHTIAHLDRRDSRLNAQLP